jgi:GAF domain-containing protein
VTHFLTDPARLKVSAEDFLAGVLSFVSVPIRSRREREASLAAQRRVATLVAGGAASAEVFAAIAREVGSVIGVPLVTVWRYETDGTATVIGAWSERPHPFEAGTRWPLDGPTVCARVLETGRPARIDDFAEVPGTIATAVRAAGMRSSAGAPIIVDGEIWGVMSTGSSDRDRLPEHTEDRLAQFTVLLAAAISNTAGREELARLADEQAALRRVATLVARGVPPPDVFAAVAREVGLVLGVEWTHMARYEPDGTSTGVAGWSPAGDQIPVGTRVDLEGESVGGLVLRTGRPARMHDYDHASGHAAALGQERGLRSAVGAPIVVDQRLWGVMMAASKGDRRLPEDAESRIAAFTELVATAISNAEARSEVQRLADEQAALRRVATLVARESRPAEVFATVAKEVSRLLDIDETAVFRYDDDDTVTVVANSNDRNPPIPVGARRTLEGQNVAGRVRRTLRPARIDGYPELDGELATAARHRGLRSGAGAPIIVNGRLWGVIVAGSPEPRLPAGAEERIGQFTELVATAIANVEARTEVAASRARIVAATDQERRRVVRDLHDGAQQRIVHAVVMLEMAGEALRNDKDNAPTLVAEALGHAKRANAELRDLAHGILPTVLTHGGLRAGVSALASPMPVPTEFDVSVGRLPPAVEATAYFVVAEALTNVAKHAHAERAEVTARIDDGTLAVRVRDDGIGGARANGSGLLGLADRLAVLDGRLWVDSPAEGGTVVAADIPLPV